MCMHKILMFAGVCSCMRVGVCRLHTCARLYMSPGCCGFPYSN